MSKEKQIEEMAYSVCRLENKPQDCASCMWKATCNEYLSAGSYYNAGYRKQREGEWKTITDNKNYVVTECTACKEQFFFMKKGQLNIDRMPYCPNCGARMKGE